MWGNTRGLFETIGTNTLGEDTSMENQSNGDWVFIEKRGEYFMWRNDAYLRDKEIQDPFYQATKTNEPPTNDAGYYSYAALLRLKDITPSIIPELGGLGL
jgi:lysine/ornithine N-monooxygenase